MGANKSPRKTPTSWRNASEVPPPGGRPILIRVFQDVTKHPHSGAWWLGRTAYAVAIVSTTKPTFNFAGKDFPVGSIEIWTNIPPE